MSGELDEAVARAHEARAEPGVDALNHDLPPASVRGQSGNRYDGVVFGMRPHDCLRRICIQSAESRWLEPLITLMIVASCVAMASVVYGEPAGTTKASILATVERAGLIIFTSEMAIKVLANGLMGHKRAYLNDGWNRLDFCVVMLAWLPILVPAMGHYAALRAVRAMRPLRTLNKLPGMPNLVASMLQTFAELGSIMIILFFTVVIFGVVGVELFGGTRQFVCVVDGNHTLALPARQPGRVLKGGGGDGDDELLILCSPGDLDVCAIGEVCQGTEPVDAVDFDGIAGAFVAIAQTITFDTWTPSMFYLMLNASSYAWIYFLLIALLGGFFIVNLFLAIVFDEFMRCKALLEAQEEVAKVVKQEVGAVRWIQRRWLEILQEQRAKAGKVLPSPPPSPPVPATADGSIPPDKSRKSASPTRAIRGSMMSGMIAERAAQLVKVALAARAKQRADFTPAKVHADMDFDDINQYQRVLEADIEELPDPKKPAGIRGIVWLRPVVESPLFQTASTLFLTINVVVMCLPFAGETEAYRELVQRLVNLLSTLFVLEIVVKYAGLGEDQFLEDGWNRFDASLGGVALLDLLAQALVAAGGINMNSLRALRVMRVLRLLRLMKNLKGVYRIFSSCMTAGQQVLNLFILLFVLMCARAQSVSSF